MRPNRLVFDRGDVRTEGPGEDLSARHIVVLVHGYNNDREKAERSFDHFSNALRRLAPAAIGSAAGPTWGFYWPTRVLGPGFFLSTYVSCARRAEATGQALANFLAGTLGPRQSVTIVGHSMGCRVALEAARQFRKLDADQAPRPRLRALALMAAAVPEPMCDPAGALFDLRCQGSKEWVFHSTHDMVLLFSFPAGQRLLREPGRAVGRRGGPPGRRWDERVETENGHGDYWPSGTVVETIANLLGVIRVRRIASISPPVVTSATEERSPESRAIAKRDVGKRG